MLQRKIQYPPSTSIMLIWPNLMHSQGPRALWEEILLCWALWHARNKQLFRATQLTSYMLLLLFSHFIWMQVISALISELLSKRMLAIAHTCLNHPCKAFILMGVAFFLMAAISLLMGHAKARQDQSEGIL